MSHQDKRAITGRRRMRGITPPVSGHNSFSIKVVHECQAGQRARCPSRGRCRRRGSPTLGASCGLGLTWSTSSGGTTTTGRQAPAGRTVDETRASGGRPESGEPEPNGGPPPKTKGKGTPTQTNDDIVPGEVIRRKAGPNAPFRGSADVTGADRLKPPRVTAQGALKTGNPRYSVI